MPHKSGKKPTVLSARGEPFQWALGGALCMGLMMIGGFFLLILWNGMGALYPRSLHLLTLKDGRVVAGEIVREETFRVQPHQLQQMDEALREQVKRNGGIANRILVRVGNFDLYNEDFKWILEGEVNTRTTPKGLLFVERTEWGPFIGTIKRLELDGYVLTGEEASLDVLKGAHKEATKRREDIRVLERKELSRINQKMERERLDLRRVAIIHGVESEEYVRAKRRHDWIMSRLEGQYRDVQSRVEALRAEDSKYSVVLVSAEGMEKVVRISEIVRFFAPNAVGSWGRIRVYASRWWELLTDEPREANTEGGVMPAIFGTFVMTVMMSLFVAPFGVIAALFLREYARQGPLVSAVRIGVNNLAGVPSIVYGVFGLGFFAYLVGGHIDAIFYPERLPSPTFGTGGLLWSSLTLALLTLPVVIVATEEAVAAVPQSMREGSLACGASRWQTIKYIVLPRAMPGILTGLMLAMARGAGEVAPLMLVGVVKLAPELPVDDVFPFVHLERSFMHLAFHIFDLGFQSRNSEAAKPMVFVTTLLLVALVALMNMGAVIVRNRLRRRFAEGHF